MDRFRGLKILWLEDNPDEGRELMVIEKLGGAVMHANSIEYAIKLVKEHAPFNFVILDYMLQGDKQSGLDFCKRLRGGEFGQWGKTVGMRFVTGYEDRLAVAIQKAKVEHPPRVVQKPLDLASTADLLHEIGGSALETESSEENLFTNKEAQQLLSLISSIHEAQFRSRIPIDEISDNLYQLFREGDQFALNEWHSWFDSLQPGELNVLSEAARVSGCSERVIDLLGLADY